MSDFHQKILIFPIEKYLEEHGISYEEKTQYFLMNCPACARVNKFIINKEAKYFTCFVCDFRGGLVSLIAYLDGISNFEACKIVGSSISYTKSNDLGSDLNIHNALSIEQKVKECLKPIDLPYFFEKIDLSIDSSISRYLLGRGFNQELIDIYNIHYSPTTQRVIFPIEDHTDRLVGWQARDITDESDIKILTSPTGLLKTLLLYNFNNVINEDTITLCEGPIDAIKAYKMNGVCMFGKQISKTQLELISLNKKLKTIYLCLDTDALQETAKLAAELSNTYIVKIVNNFGTKNDIGACTLEEAEHYIKSAIDYNKYENKLVSL